MKKIKIALAGNANVGKSVVFNQLTGLHQHIGNWPGKTVEKAEGSLHFKGHDIDVIDLPGIYSLSTFSMEEIISRNYILNEKPDVVINVIDASVLERNLYFTTQLLELGCPVVVALNQIDTAKKKGIEINSEKLSNLLGVPVVPTIAVKSQGIAELLEVSVKSATEKKIPSPIKYGEEIEKSIRDISGMLKEKRMKYPKRWLAVKLLQKDKEIENMPIDNAITEQAKKSMKIIESIHKHSCETAMCSEIYSKSAEMTKKVEKKVINEEKLFDKFDNISTHRLWGYPIMMALLLAVFFSIFLTGNFLAGMMEGAYSQIQGQLQATFPGITGSLFIAVIEGIFSALTVVLPYILPFYLILGILESSGYLARIAFLMDSTMHKIGLHGKAFIPLMMGFGCNVPACLGCRIMETRRERLIAIFVTTLIPCAAVTTVILGMVGRFVSIWHALGLYVIDALIIFALGRIAFKALPGEPTGLIMEMPSYKIPHVKTVVKQTWFKLKNFVYIAFPIIIAGTLFIKILDIFGALEVISGAMSPVTVFWLGLPAVTGILLIFGILKKELTLIMLATYLGTTNFALVMTPVQMMVFALVVMLYIPCAATVAALVKEIGYKKALLITVVEVVFAIIVGGIAYRLFTFIGL